MLYLFYGQKIRREHFLLEYTKLCVRKTLVLLIHFFKNQTDQPGKRMSFSIPARAVILNDWANSFECNPAMKKKEKEKKMYGPSIPFETITIDTNHHHHLRIGIEQVGNVTER